MSALTTIEVRAADGRARASIPRLRLRVVDGPDVGASFAATGERVVLGTHDSADLVLADKTVSRFHCEIALRGERVEIRDLGSRNGTRVDGVTVLHAVLHAGAAVTVGGTRLVFEVDAPGVVHLPLAGGDRFGAMVGRSLVMRTAFARLERAAASEATVLLEGESGTGKELAAEAIHAASARRAGPFVGVYCGAIPPELLESELFGHERGAFTGALTARDGAFAAAHGGTVFLDEIGELSLALQPKLLRALERREIKPVGRTAYQAADVRVVAATNRDLRAEVNAGRFRTDLYYRLAVIDVRLPALRERADDLPALVEHILGALGAATRPEADLVRRPEFLAGLAAHPWPGNVRELRNHVERCLALRAIEPLSAATTAAPPVPDDLRDARDGWERGYLETLLARHGGNVSAAARAAGIDRKYLYKLLWRNGLR
jgi:DNA-binding NtrC family response regulator